MPAGNSDETAAFMTAKDFQLDLSPREALQRTRDDESVTDIAMAWGFYHPARFAIEYTRRFGESPRTAETAARPS